jgi:hypothetical protein
VHPDLLGALARQHQADLLDRARTPPVSGGPPSAHPFRVRRPIRRVRYSLGVVLVAAGQRLLRTRSTVADLSEVRP